MYTVELSFWREARVFDIVPWSVPAELVKVAERVFLKKALAISHRRLQAFDDVICNPDVSTFR